MKIEEIPIASIKVVENFRKNIDDENIHELMQSIKQNGLKQAVGVTAIDGGYKLLFGNRRLRACLKLGWDKIPAVIETDTTSQSEIVTNLTENLQRKDPSFSELGRGIERLEKMGLSSKEVAVRLGISELKVKSIAKTYKGLPQKHRDNVRFESNGKGEKNNHLPAHTATLIASIKKEVGLSDKDLDELIKYCKETKMSRQDLKNLTIFLNSGIKLQDAIDKMCDYHVYTVDFVAHRMFLTKRLEEEKLTSPRTLFKKILYGQLKGISKPDFIKL